jgi:hypothetical protein
VQLDKYRAFVVGVVVDAVCSVVDDVCSVVDDVCSVVDGVSVWVVDICASLCMHLAKNIRTPIMKSLSFMDRTDLNTVF